MTQVDLGRAMRRTPDYGPLADMVAGMRESIVREVCDNLTTTIASAVASAVAGAVTAQVTVQSPPPAQVSVTPTINVETPGEDDAGEIDAMDRQTEILTQISAQLGKLLALAQKPVTTRVERDSADRITQTTASR